MKVNNNMSSTHMSEVMEIYKSVPSPNDMDYDLYQAILNSIKAFDNNIENGKVLATLQSIVIMMCESCIQYDEDMNYKDIQESMK